MTPEFGRLVNPYFGMVLELADRLRRREGVNLAVDKKKLLAELNEAEQGAAESRSIVTDHFELAKRALVFWTDEVLTMADSRWKDTTLEFQLYGTKDRGYLFYTEGVNKALASHADVLEVWYLSLALGFRGDIEEAFKYHLNQDLPGGHNDPEQARLAWADELRAHLQSKPPTAPAAPPPDGELSDLKGHRLYPRAVATLASAALLAIGLWAFYERVVAVTADRPAETETRSDGFDVEGL